MSDPATPPQIFDRALLQKRRTRSAATVMRASFLHERAMADIVDRLETTTRSFDKAIFYGGYGFTGAVTKRCGIGNIFHGDLSSARIPEGGFAGDEERWPIASQSVDLVISLLTLHYANDLVGALAQMRSSLKPDGLFIAALFGEDTLRALREALYDAETKVKGGVSPRVAPFANVRDLGGAMQRAGFAMPVADLDRMLVHYQNPKRLLEDLRNMGEASILYRRGSAMSRELLEETAEGLAKRSDDIAFDIVYLTGWAPHHAQPKPLAPGSANKSMAEAVMSKINKP